MTLGRRRFLNDLRRAAILSAIVLITGAMSCTTIEGGIQFAPGYGYVIEIGRGSKSEHTYFVFETLAEAEKWALNFQQTPDKSIALGAPGYKQRLDDGDISDQELFDKIKAALKTPSNPPGASDINRAIDQVVPPIPTAPAPR